MKVRRPSLALVVASLALFIALGGPAHAQRLINGKLLRKGSVTTRAVKNRSLQVEDLSQRAERSLRSVPNNSITEAKLANGSITPGKLAAGAVGSRALADRSIGAIDLAASSVGAAALVDGSVGGAKVTDGSLDARDLGRYWGRFRTTVGIDPATGTRTGIEPESCWAADPTGLAPERAGADIGDDLVLVTPDQRWPHERLSLTVRNSAVNRSRFTLVACNATGTRAPAEDVGFRYLVIDLP